MEQAIQEILKRLNPGQHHRFNDEWVHIIKTNTRLRMANLNARDILHEMLNRGLVKKIRDAGSEVIIELNGGEHNIRTNNVWTRILKFSKSYWKWVVGTVIGGTIAITTLLSNLETIYKGKIWNDVRGSGKDSIQSKGLKSKSQEQFQLTQDSLNIKHTKNQILDSTNNDKK
ncbi:hypothetical protein WSM22_38660 [Cytophagales bacterium WSM2-2]|nr:hypothetical protein WSM22_38660 [Cytophagales bacterium WSM2-2]